jgi:hypothetical protein
MGRLMTLRLILKRAAVVVLVGLLMFDPTTAHALASPSPTRMAPHASSFTNQALTLKIVDVIHSFGAFSPARLWQAHRASTMSDRFGAHPARRSMGFLQIQGDTVPDLELKQAKEYLAALFPALVSTLDQITQARYVRFPDALQGAVLLRPIPNNPFWELLITPQERALPDLLRAVFLRMHLAAETAELHVAILRHTASALLQLKAPQIDRDLFGMIVQAAVYFKLSPEEQKALYAQAQAFEEQDKKLDPNAPLRFTPLLDLYNTLGSAAAVASEENHEKLLEFLKKYELLKNAIDQPEDIKTWVASLLPLSSPKPAAAAQDQNRIIGEQILEALASNDFQRYETLIAPLEGTHRVHIPWKQVPSLRSIARPYHPGDVYLYCSDLNTLYPDWVYKIYAMTLTGSYITTIDNPFSTKKIEYLEGVGIYPNPGKRLVFGPEDFLGPGGRLLATAAEFENARQRIASAGNPDRLEAVFKSTGVSSVENFEKLLRQLFGKDLKIDVEEIEDDRAYFDFHENVLRAVYLPILDFGPLNAISLLESFIAAFREDKRAKQNPDYATLLGLFEQLLKRWEILSAKATTESGNRSLTSVTADNPSDLFNALPWPETGGSKRYKGITMTKGNDGRYLLAFPGLISPWSGKNDNSGELYKRIFWQEIGPNGKPRLTALIPDNVTNWVLSRETKEGHEYRFILERDYFDPNAQRPATWQEELTDVLGRVFADFPAFELKFDHAETRTSMIDCILTVPTTFTSSIEAIDNILDGPAKKWPFTGNAHDIQLQQIREQLVERHAAAAESDSVSVPETRIRRMERRLEEVRKEIETAHGTRRDKLKADLEWLAKELFEARGYGNSKFVLEPTTLMLALSSLLGASVKLFALNPQTLIQNPIFMTVTITAASAIFLPELKKYFGQAPRKARLWAA